MHRRRLASQVRPATRRAGSGFGHGPAEVLQGDVGRLPAAALVGVEAVDGGQVVLGQFRVEDVEVLGDAVRLGRLGDDRAAFLQVPAAGVSSGGVGNTSRPRAGISTSLLRLRFVIPSTVGRPRRLPGGPVNTPFQAGGLLAR